MHDVGRLHLVDGQRSQLGQNYLVQVPDAVAHRIDCQATQLLAFEVLDQLPHRGDLGGAGLFLALLHRWIVAPVDRGAQLPGGLPGLGQRDVWVVPDGHLFLRAAKAIPQHPGGRAGRRKGEGQAVAIAARDAFAGGDPPTQLDIVQQVRSTLCHTGLPLILSSWGPWLLIWLLIELSPAKYYMARSETKQPAFMRAGGEVGVQWETV